MCPWVEKSCITNNRTKNPGSYTSRSNKRINDPRLTPTGKDWLTRALDPFHDDVSVPKAGLPDFSPHATLIKEHNRSINIVKPPTVLEGETWHCAIFTMPNLNNSNYRKVLDSANGNIVLHSGQDSILNGDTITVVTWPAENGSDWFLPDTDNNFVTGVQFSGISLFENGTTPGPHSLTRLIGGGFEVANTTSNLYKQGNFLAASCPQMIERDMIPALTDQNTSETMGTPSYTLRLPPTSIEQVRANPNCVSWPAEHGCYIPFRMDHSKNNFSIPIDIPLLFVNAGAEAQQALLSSVDLPTTGANNIRFPSVYYKPFISPLSQQVAMFTGLSSQTTLTLNARFIEEVAPISDLELLSYGPEVYPADPIAIEMYQRAIIDLPVAVTFEENASAEFWSKVVKTLASVASPVAGAMGGPVASALVSSVAKAVTDRLDKKAIQQKAQAVTASKQTQKVANKKK